MALNIRYKVRLQYSESRAKVLGDLEDSKIKVKRQKIQNGVKSCIDISLFPPLSTRTPNLFVQTQLNYNRITQQAAAVCSG